MSLNDSKIRNVKLSPKPFKVSDSHGLYLQVKPTRSHLWYFRYYLKWQRDPRIALSAEGTEHSRA